MCIGIRNKSLFMFDMAADAQARQPGTSISKYSEEDVSLSKQFYKTLRFMKWSLLKFMYSNEDLPPPLIYTS